MYKYILRRLFLAVPVLVLSSLIVFSLMRVMPGDALTALMAESGNVGEKDLKKLRKDLGLDLPYYQQYLIWVRQMVTLDPGYSIFTNEPIAVALKKAVPVTIELAVLAMILGLVIAVPIGVISATRQDRPSDYAGRTGGDVRPVAAGFLARHARHHVRGDLVRLDSQARLREPLGVPMAEPPAVPAARRGARLPPLRATMRMTRSTVLEVLREDYVRTAWAKGLGERIIVYKHALKNALIPVITLVGGQLGTLLAAPSSWRRSSRCRAWVGSPSRRSSSATIRSCKPTSCWSRGRW